MSHLAPLISDLALILISAGIMTLLFKKLKQPLVLGYIVAGFVCSPHFAFTPSVVDADNIQTWSEIGVIFLFVCAGIGIQLQETDEGGRFGGHIGLYDYLLHDTGRCVCGLDVWMETDGLHLFGRNAGHVFHHHYL